MYTKLLTFGLLSALPLAAHAVTFNVQPLDPVAYAASFGEDALATEAFETIGTAGGPREVPGLLATSVGTFTTLGGTGSGGTVQQLPGNTGTSLALRNGNVFGRTDPTSPGNYFLDSNDTRGIVWNVGLAGGAMFDRLRFTVTDASDVGGFMRMSLGSDGYETRTGKRLSNGNALEVEVLFDKLVSSATINFANYTQSGGSIFFANDGFSIDQIQAFGPSPVPLPAAGVLLSLALVSAAAVGLRRKKAA